MSDFLFGEWYVTVDGVRYEGTIYSTEIPINCGVDLWTLECYDSTHLKRIQITAPRTAFRKVKP
jgi:hypothetical protein